jgi:3-isopropylmalate/(R)-2-methylmalate dehydratase large subunit
MRMTMTQKILAAHAGLKHVEEGQLIEAKLDLVLGNDITAPVAIREFENCGATKVFDPSKIALVPDHFAPNKDIKAAEQCKAMRGFAMDKGIEHYFEIGRMGIEHALIPESGLVLPGELVIGADSHTCTYGAVGAFSTGVGSTDMAAGMALGSAWFKVPGAIQVLLRGAPRGWVSGKDLILHLIGLIGVDGALYKSLEFAGSGVAALSMDERFTVANMAIEAGAKNGIFPVDEATLAWAASVSERPYTVYAPDDDAVYERVIDIDLSALEPTVAFPSLPSNTRTIAAASGVAVDQVVIGSCTNGRIEDLRVAAAILKGRRVSQKVRCIVFPATQKIYLQALREGLIEALVEAGAVVSTPTCGPCLGGHMGILAAGESAVATTNRNFVGRMGDPSSKVYLASPAVAAAAALDGRLVDPASILAAPERPAPAQALAARSSQ